MQELMTNFKNKYGQTIPLPKIYQDEDSSNDEGLALGDGTRYGRKTPGGGGGKGGGVEAEVVDARVAMGVMGPKPGPSQSGGSGAGGSVGGGGSGTGGRQPGKRGRDDNDNDDDPNKCRKTGG